MFLKICLFIIFFIASQATGTAQVLKFDTVKIAYGVYAVIREVDSLLPSDANSIFIINDNDVIVIDANITPSSSRAVLAEIRKLTDKPVRYVVNTHGHSDHFYGNNIYQDAFPQVEFIAHSNTRRAFEKEIPTEHKNFVENSRKFLVEAPERLKTGKNLNGELMTEQEKADLVRRVENRKKYLFEIEQVRLVAATLTVEKELTLYRGRRLIKILYLGRGNTRGDLVIYLPQEKILITGDLLVNPVPFSFGSYIGDWIQTLKKMRELEAGVIVPGHGPIQRNKEYIDLVTSLLEAVVKQTQDAVKRGLSLDETRKVVDLEFFRLRLAGDDVTLNRAFQQFFVTPAVERAYKEAKGEIE